MSRQKAKKPAKSKAPPKLVAAKNGKPRNGKAGEPPKRAPTPLSTAKAQQYQDFERAIGLLNQRNYRDAKEMFEKAKLGPSLAMSAHAASHIRMCERRLGAVAPEPKSAEDHYNYAVALLNARNLDLARQHLGAALESEPRADHVHYALGVCLALSGDASGAYDSLKRAIELQPRNRMVARQDSDLDGISKQLRFSRLFYPE